jgi:hypothetical protein
MNTNSNAETVNETPVAKRGRGRPAGSNSFTNVQIKTLLSLLSEEASIPVSKIWLRDTLSIVSAPAPTQRIVSVPSEQEAEEKVQFSIEKFEDSNCPF